MAAENNQRRGGGRSTYRSQRAGRGGRGRGGRGNAGGARSKNNNYSRNKNSRRQPSLSMNDEEVLVCFTPYLRAKDPEAVHIHEKFTAVPTVGRVKGNEQKAFLEEVRTFLSSRNSNEAMNPNSNYYHQPYDNMLKSKPDPPVIPKILQKPQHNDGFPQTLIPINNNINGDIVDLELEDDHDHYEMSSMVKAVTDLIDSDNSDVEDSQKPILDVPRPATAIQNFNINPLHVKPTQAKDISSETTNLAQVSTASSLVSNGATFHSTLTDHSLPEVLSNQPNETFHQTNDDKKQVGPNVQRKDHTKNYHLPKRYVRNQPGTILANNIPSSGILTIPPRRELTARWSIPLAYLRERWLKKSPVPENPPAITVRDALETLSVGLFRRGCAENGSSSSIVSKEVMSSSLNREQFHFAVDPNTDTVWGEVPFYSPRSPGNIVFRLYFENDPIHTLATGPTIVVDVQEDDLESTLRFILSNFKSKKGSGISSMYSLAVVFDNFQVSTNQFSSGHSSNSHHQHRTVYEGAGRAAWGCICESRKVFLATEEEYLKRKAKVLLVEDDLKQMKQDILKTEEARESSSDNGPIKDVNTKSETKFDLNTQPSDAGGKITNSDDNEGEEILTGDKWKEKMSAVMSEKAINEKKWREVQAAYSSILRAVIGNNSCTLFIRRDLIMKLRLENELWCPLCEQFAPNPFHHQQNDPAIETFPFPHPINSSHFQLCGKARTDMQLKNLGFIPHFESIQYLLKSYAHRYPKTTHTNNNMAKTNANSNAQAVFQRLTASMHSLFSDRLGPNADFYHKRDAIRSHLQLILEQCHDFPPGTKIAIFGSSMNGFGSSNSDLDLCLQFTDASVLSEVGKNAYNLLSKLAEDLNTAGMQNINTSRLSARIPIVMFDYPFRNNDLNANDVSLIPCEISMQNQLALLNTSLLQTYSMIDPRIRVLASIIKLWANRRDINNPSHHTLSTYGYLIMMLQFLTQFRGSNGILSQNDHDLPLLPNLQWIDFINSSHNANVKSPQKRNNAKFQQLQTKPNNPHYMMKHPTVQDFIVNTYFYKPSNPHEMLKLQQNFTGANRTSVGILLASFFRYYAYEFDYKKFVVSLNSTSSFGMMEKETKGETEGWKLFGSGIILAIEDPFETFYDVAHVLKVSSFHRIRKEFALAFTKIVESITLKDLSGDELINWICEDVKNSEE